MLPRTTARRCSPAARPRHVSGHPRTGRTARTNPSRRRPSASCALNFPVLDGRDQAAAAHRGADSATPPRERAMSAVLPPDGIPYTCARPEILESNARSRWPRVRREVRSWTRGDDHLPGGHRQGPIEGDAVAGSPTSSDTRSLGDMTSRWRHANGTPRADGIKSPDDREISEGGGQGQDGRCGSSQDGETIAARAIHVS